MFMMCEDCAVFFCFGFAHLLVIITFMRQELPSLFAAEEVRKESEVVASLLVSGGACVNHIQFRSGALAFNHCIKCVISCFEK